jgi:hypothetical protein
MNSRTRTPPRSRSGPGSGRTSTCATSAAVLQRDDSTKGVGRGSAEDEGGNRLEEPGSPKVSCVGAVRPEQRSAGRGMSRRTHAWGSWLAARVTCYFSSHHTRGGATPTTSRSPKARRGGGPGTGAAMLDCVAEAAREHRRRSRPTDEHVWLLSYCRAPGNFRLFRRRY